MTENPKSGDLLECEKCGSQIQIVRPCECESGCIELRCCGQDMATASDQAEAS